MVQENLWCVFEECGPRGQIVAILGGWLQGENSKQPAIKDGYGFAGKRESEITCNSW